MADKNMKSWLILVAMFLIMLVLNILMPLHRDDYDYALIWGTYQHIESMADVFESAWRHYLFHGGRIVTLGSLMFFLQWDKLLFDIVNAVFFVIFTVLIYMHGRRSIDFAQPGLMAICAIFSWLCFPHFGEVAIWKCGATVYLWSGLFAAVFLLPYNLKLAGRWSLNNGWFAIVSLFLGVLAGWSVENLGVTVTLLTAGICYYLHRKGETVPAWMISGAVGALVGLIGLLAAPGNWVRYNEQGAEAGEGLLITMVYHINNQFGGNGEMLLYTLPALLLFVLGWRLLQAEYVRKTFNLERIPVKAGLSAGRIVLLIFIGLTTISYFTTGFVGKTLHDILEAGVLRPLGLTRPITLILFANLMDGFDEMAVYWFFVFFMFSYLKEKLGLTPAFLKEIKGKAKLKMLVREYPGFGFAMFLIILAVANNFVMIAAPTFPGRATFSSTAMLLAAVVALLDIPEVRNNLFAVATGKIMQKAAVFLTAFTVLSAMTIMYNMKQANDERLAMVVEAAASGKTEVVMPPIMSRGRALRHVYFEDFYNNVTTHGLINYYGIKKIKVSPLPPWVR